ncbi:cGMP-specific 3',5'-cyclic phosphodiesterase [Hondaea fermentalgiana]|uniref:cGMP-specific 3',5'-cyclic phosphodiesterase n=1 Tax=Hondaea fermentalgiana TaxID=2315210 RepID=A0A2R5G8H3_9STRA|nr:cGMP-specific 3',5'-cyclic phosphodiesterase [Hondaea fermentalgiana]|eukprot:GBG27300.1 cGMP-specific 3',5'-cyclic phosphodiesterase [Hondaea fermentalgiana]
MGAGASASKQDKYASKDLHDAMNNDGHASFKGADDSTRMEKPAQPVRSNSRKAILAARRADQAEYDSDTADNQSQTSIASLGRGELLKEIALATEPAQLDALLEECRDDADELALVARESIAQLRRLLQVNHLARELSRQHDNKSQYAYIVRSLSHIVGADRAILYSVDPGTKTLRMQVARHFDLDDDENGEGTSFDAKAKSKVAFNIKSPPIAIGEGIPGEVARTGVSINSSDAYANPRFDPSIDASAETKTVSLLTVPIGLPETAAPVKLGRGFTTTDLETVHAQERMRCQPKSAADLREERLFVIGVVQVINKRNEAGEIIPFTADDQLVLEASSSIIAGYLNHVQLREKEENERRRKEAILDIAVALGGTLDIRSLIWTVADRLRYTFAVERCSLFFVDEETQTLWTVASSFAKEWEKLAAGSGIIRLPLGKGIAGHVARTGEMVNVENAYEDERFNQELDRQTHFKTRTILCGPIKNSEGKVVAVIQLINKTNGDVSSKSQAVPSNTPSDLHRSVSLTARRQPECPKNDDAAEPSVGGRPSSIANRSGIKSLASSFRIHVSPMRRRSSVVYGTGDGYEAFDKDDEQLLSGLFSMLSVAIANTELFSNSFIARHRLKCVLENVAELVLTVDKEGMLMGCNRSSTEVNQLFGTDIPANVMRTTKVTEWLPDEVLASQMRRLLKEAISDQRRARNMGVTQSDYTIQSGGHVVNYTMKPMFGMGTGLTQLIRAQQDAQLGGQSVVQQESSATLTAAADLPANMPAGLPPGTQALSKPPLLSKSWSNFGSTRSVITTTFGEEDTDLMEAQFFAGPRQQHGNTSTGQGREGMGDNEVIGAVLCLDDKTPEQKLRSTLNKYLAPDLVDHLLHDGQLKLGGTRQQVTILFSDIRGFTTFSEQVGAQEIFGTLNEYFSCMVEVITRYGGIVDKFIGDALMAVFGVPKQSEHDAYNACLAARAMETALSDFNAARRAKGKPIIKIGIGISTGEVYCGNIGSENRFEYTVIGDAVNVASRLESTTKEFAVPNLISAGTYDEIVESGCPVQIVNGDTVASCSKSESRTVASAAADVEEGKEETKDAEEQKQDHRGGSTSEDTSILWLREVDRVRVAGQNAQTQLFEILGVGRSLSDVISEKQVSAIRDYSAGLRAYRARDIETALKHFGAAADLNDGPACLFEERCEFLIKNPPGESWDGVWDMQKVSVWTYNPGADAAGASAEPRAMDPLMRRLSRKSSVAEPKAGTFLRQTTASSVHSLPANTGSHSTQSNAENQGAKDAQSEQQGLPTLGQNRIKRAKSIIADLGVPNAEDVEAARKRGVEVVFLMHGRLGKREHVLRHAVRFAERGFMAVYWDNPNHGRRILDASRNNAWNAGNLQHATDMYAQMLGALRDLQMFLDFLPALLSVNFLRTGIFGISQGGHTTLVMMGQEPRIDVCVSLISSGDYMVNMQRRYEALRASASDAQKDTNTSLPSFDTLVPGALQRTLDRYDPIRNVDAVATGCRPILMVNGGADDLVPLECNTKLHAALEPLYTSKSGNLQHLVLEGVKHATPEPMIQAAEDWFETHLRESSSLL